MTPTLETVDEIEATAHERIAEGHTLLARACRMRIESLADAWIPLDVAGRELGIRPRVIMDAARRGEIKLGGAGRRRVVLRSELTRWVASRPAKVSVTNDVDDDRAEERASLERAVERIRKRG